MSKILKYKHTIVCATQEKTATNTLLVQSLQRHKIIDTPNVSCSVVVENKRGLGDLYGWLFQSLKPSTDIMTFIHDDVEILDKNFLFTIESAFARHPHWHILGLAGIKKYNINEVLKAYLSNFRVEWANSPNRPHDWAGKVWHRKNHQTWVSDYGPYDVDASVVDGLFLSLKVINMSESPFDPDFDFHHYDISMCVRAAQLNYNIGIFHTPVIHEGLGDSMFSASWVNNNKKFLNKFCHNIN